MFCIGMTVVQSSLIWYWFLLIGHFQFGIDYLFVSLFKRDWNYWASSFHLSFGLACLFLFLDKHSLIHLQLISHFVANFNSAFWPITDWLLQVTRPGTTDTLVFCLCFWMCFISGFVVNFCSVFLTGLLVGRCRIRHLKQQTVLYLCFL